MLDSSKDLTKVKAVKTGLLWEGCTWCTCAMRISAKEKLYMDNIKSTANEFPYLENALYCLPKTKFQFLLYG